MIDLLSEEGLGWLEERSARLHHRPKRWLGQVDLLDGIDERIAKHYREFEDHALAYLSTELAESGSRLSGIRPDGCIYNLDSLRSSIVGLSYEVCLGVDSSGKVIFAKSGEENRIPLSWRERILLNGCEHFIHNHPGQQGELLALSYGDIICAHSLNIGRMEAVNHCWYCWINRPLRGWNNIPRATLRTQMESCSLTPRSSNSPDRDHLRNYRLAQNLGCDYQRVKRDGK